MATSFSILYITVCIPFGLWITAVTIVAVEVIFTASHLIQLVVLRLFHKFLTRLRPRPIVCTAAHFCLEQMLTSKRRRLHGIIINSSREMDPGSADVNYLLHFRIEMLGMTAHFHCSDYRAVSLHEMSVAGILVFRCLVPKCVCLIFLQPPSSSGASNETRHLRL
jgi:hypothetical protein